MCVIIVKDKMGKLPTKESLENCFKRNSDGAGFMYTDENGKVTIDKGYMKFNNFYKHYKKLCKKFNNFEGKNLVMHMRISTSGGVKPENTHPFMLSNKFEDMKKTYKKCEMGVVHNGIISATHPSKEQESNGINDTMIFIKEYLEPIYKDWKNCFKNSSFLAGIVEITHSKFAVLKENDELYMIGDFQKYEDTYYSNDSYRGYTYTYTYGGKKYDYYDYLDDYYDDDYYMKKYSEYFKKKEKEKVVDITDKFDEFTEDYTEDFTDNYDEDYDIIQLEDYDYIIFDDGYGERAIEELRTASNSKFFYDFNTCSLEEISSAGIVLNTYYNCYLYAHDLN